MKCKQNDHGNIDCDRTPLRGEGFCLYHLPCHLRSEIDKKDAIIKNLLIKLGVLKNDFWFMSNLIERYGSNKDQTLKDCLERMKFRSPLFLDLISESKQSNEMEKELIDLWNRLSPHDKGEAEAYGAFPIARSLSKERRNHG